jgi:hypothetical protein
MPPRWAARRDTSISSRRLGDGCAGTEPQHLRVRLSRQCLHPASGQMAGRVPRRLREGGACWLAVQSADPCAAGRSSAAATPRNGRGSRARTASPFRRRPGSVDQGLLAQEAAPWPIRAPRQRTGPDLCNKRHPDLRPKRHHASGRSSRWGARVRFSRHSAGLNRPPGIAGGRGIGPAAPPRSRSGWGFLLVVDLVKKTLRWVRSAKDASDLEKTPLPGGLRQCRHRE